MEVSSDGSFEIVIPYSTFGKEGMIEGETQFSVFASPYSLKIGEKEIEVDVLEEQVLEGKEIVL